MRIQIICIFRFNFISLRQAQMLINQKHINVLINWNCLWKRDTSWHCPSIQRHTHTHWPGCAMNRKDFHLISTLQDVYLFCSSLSRLCIQYVFNALRFACMLLVNENVLFSLAQRYSMLLDFVFSVWLFVVIYLLPLLLSYTLFTLQIWLFHSFVVSIWIFTIAVITITASSRYDIDVHPKKNQYPNKILYLCK